MSHSVQDDLISIVIPAYDEAASLPDLIDGIRKTCEKIERNFEVIIVDDGSSDRTFEVVSKLHAQDERVRGIRFRGNFGKSAALSAGFQAARGSIIFTMDGDLQDDPEEIPHFLAKLNEGYDLVSGWKEVRHDPLSKTLPSHLFNKTTALLTGVGLHDFNCGFKAYRRELIDQLEIYGELHRYIPVLADQLRFRIGEISVKHHPRKHGKSKYGIERFTRGLLDLMTILFLTKYLKKPAHLFGGTGLFLSGSGFLICLYMTFIWIIGQGPIGNRPLLLFGVLLLVTGVQFISMGLIGELITSQTRPSEKAYSIIETVG